MLQEQVSGHAFKSWTTSGCWESDHKHTHAHTHTHTLSHSHTHTHTHTLTHSHTHAHTHTHTRERSSLLYDETLLFSSQYALHVYNEVMSVGQKYGIRNAGYYALRSLRIEKFFAFWGQDLDSFTTPLECGREFRVKFDKVRFFPVCSNIHITAGVTHMQCAVLENN